MTTIDKDSITLKNVKIYDELSEETICFSAIMYVDGEKFAKVSNTGKGGCNDYSTFKPFKYFIGDIDLDTHIMELACDYDFVNKNQSKNFVLKQGEKYFTAKFPMSITQLKKLPNYNAWVKKQINKFKESGYTTLNNNL